MYHNQVQSVWSSVITLWSIGTMLAFVVFPEERRSPPMLIAKGFCAAILLVGLVVVLAYVREVALAHLSLLVSPK